MHYWRLCEQRADIDHHARHEHRRQRRVGQPLARCVSALFRLAINLDGAAWEIEDPDLWNAELRVERKLDSAIVGKGGFRDFDEEENIRGARMTRAIVV